MSKYAIKNKKPVQMKLSSMSEHWQHMNPIKSGKHNSQEMQKRAKRRRKIMLRTGRRIYRFPII
jgi:hypothetical protein